MCQFALQAPDRLVPTHSAGSLKGWQFRSGHGSACIHHCQGPLEDPHAHLFSRAPFFCVGLGIKGSSCLGSRGWSRLGQHSSCNSCLGPRSLTPSPPRPVTTDSFVGFLSCLPISSLKHGASGPSPKEITSLVGTPHRTPHLVGLTGHKGSFGASFSGQLARDPGRTISQSVWKVSFPFSVALEKKEGWRQA